jgi:hypothetical protein
MAEREGIAGGPRSFATGAASVARELAPLRPFDELTDPDEWHATPLLPERYRVRETEDGRFLHCEEAPRMLVSVDRSHAFSEAEARELGKRVILLDGAGSFPPLLDHKARLYNLDHHAGCERTFTLATCEQALLVVHGGLDLSEGDWTVYANEPDLDTVLAIWCLLNYQRLATLDERARNVLLPIIRLEGAIDANGTEMAKLCGLPDSVLAEANRRIEGLMARERAVKAQGEWNDVDPLEFTLEVLGDIDHLIYTVGDFSEYASVEEVYGHVEIAQRRVAVVCRDQTGIYEVEKNLQERWGDQLGIVALEKEPHHFTLRRPAALSEIDLGKAYEMLNLLDPAVDGRPPSKLWGGSAQIGGSPRPTGTKLGPGELLKILRLAYRRPTKLARLGHVALAFTIGLGLLAVPGVITLAWSVVPDLKLEPALAQVARLTTFSMLVIFVTWILARGLSDGRTWLFGVRRPAWGRWLYLAPLPVIAAIPARAWVPQGITFEPTEMLAGAVGALVLTAFAVEFWFRGLVHGTMILDTPIMRVGGRWFLSRAAVVSSIVYATATLAATVPWLMIAPTDLVSLTDEIGIVFGASLVGGLALAAIRERSKSLLPGFFLQVLGGLASAAVWIGFVP